MKKIDKTQPTKILAELSTESLIRYRDAFETLVGMARELNNLDSLDNYATSYHYIKGLVENRES